jgi:hypothetical protein
MESSRLVSRRVSAGLFLWIALAAMAAIQGSPATAQAPRPPGMRTIDLPLLLDLPGDLAYVRYTPGSLDRSAAVQARFERFAQEFQKSGFPATAIVLYVLSREDWKEAGLRTPYGMPEPLGLDAIAVPAFADAPVVGTWRDRLGGELPLPQGQPILITPEESGALAVVDLVTQMEVARMLVRRASLGGDAPWIEPLLVHVALRLAWDRFEPGRIFEIAAILDRLSTQDETPGGHRLADWKDGLPFPERCWFDARFLRGADVLAMKSSNRTLWHFIQKAHAGKKPLTAAWLLKEYPPLAEWMKMSFAP